MAQTSIRLPITNNLAGGVYTARLHIGAAAAPVHLLLDTGSSMLALSGGVYDPAHDTAAKTTSILQVAHYLSGSFTAGVVQTPVSLTDEGDSGAINIQDVNLAVTYDRRPSVFGAVDGIWGLAFKALDNAYTMPADTWSNRYDADQINLGRSCDLDPCFDQLTSSGLIGKRFAFATKRSLQSLRSDDPVNDPVNKGVFVLGGGEDCVDLFSGPFATATILSEQHYHTTLLSIQVGNQPSIPVAAVAPGSAVVSNSIIDSGTTKLILDQDLYDRVIASFATINDVFASQLRRFQGGEDASIDQSSIEIDRWPPIRLGFQSPAGAPNIVTIEPEDYWQFDVSKQGMAVAVLQGDNGMLGGQSILGLPLFSGNYVVFDRTVSGRGTVAFARQP